MSRYADHLTDVADVLLSTAEGSEVRVNIGEETTGVGIAQDVQVWGPDGFISRPNDPSDKGCAQVLYLAEGQQRRVFATRDNRFAKQAGTLEPGDRMIVTRGAPRIYMKAEGQRVGLYTESADTPAVGGKSMVVDLNGQEGTILVKHGGRLVQFGADGSLSLVCAGTATQSSIVMTPNNVTITAGTINLVGTCALGFNSDMTGPVKPGVETVLVGAMGQTGVPSTKVFAASY